MKTYNISVSEDDLVLLSGVFHNYKDCFRGDADMILPAMELEKKFKDQTEGAYEPDPTYDVKMPEWVKVGDKVKFKKGTPSYKMYGEDEYIVVEIVPDGGYIGETEHNISGQPLIIIESLPNRVVRFRYFEEELRPA